MPPVLGVTVAPEPPTGDRLDPLEAFHRGAAHRR